MNEEDLKNELLEFYGGESLPAAKADRLKALADLNVTGASSARSSTFGRFGGAVMGLAACLAGVLIGTTWSNYQHDARPLVSMPPAGEDTGRKAVAPQNVRLTSTLEGLPNLVAVRVYADWCAQTPVITPIFRKLNDSYCDRPVMFVSFDITTETTLKQARLLAKALGLGQLCDESIRPGTIHLFDRQRGEVLATLTQQEQILEIEGAIDLALAESDQDESG